MQNKFRADKASIQNRLWNIGTFARLTLRGVDERALTSLTVLCPLKVLL